MGLLLALRAPLNSLFCDRCLVNLLRSLDWQVFFVPRVRVTMAQTRSFATIGSSLWNALPSSVRLTLLSGSLSASLCLLKTYFYSQCLHTESATEWSLP